MATTRANAVQNSLLFMTPPFLASVLAPRCERKAAAAPLDHQPAAKHTAEVGEMGDAGRRAGDAESELQRAVESDEHARRHRDRQGDEAHLSLREEPAEGEQQAEHRTRGAYCGQGLAAHP